jgi:hypothetical protein
MRELNNYVKQGSEIKVVADTDEAEQTVNEIKVGFHNLRTEFVKADTTDRDVIKSMKPEIYDHIIVLSYIDNMEIQQADSKTLITLLQLRHISEQENIDMSIVSEMMDLRNRALAEVTKADDFIVSDKMISMLIAQISENKALMRVYNDLFQEEGSEIYLKPASDFVQIGVPVNFYTVVESASRQGHSAFGYRIVAEAFNPAEVYGVKINPNKSEMITFAEEDKIIVMAED